MITSDHFAPLAQGRNSASPRGGRQKTGPETWLDIRDVADGARGYSRNYFKGEKTEANPK